MKSCDRALLSVKPPHAYVGPRQKASHDVAATSCHANARVALMTTKAQRVALHVQASRRRKKGNNFALGVQSKTQTATINRAYLRWAMYSLRAPGVRVAKARAAALEFALAHATHVRMRTQ